MQKESYSAMYIKKGLRMIRLCNLQYEILYHLQHSNTGFSTSRYRLYENPMEILQSMQSWRCKVIATIQPLNVTKSLHSYVNLNGMPEDRWPLYKLGIIDKEIA